MRILVFHERQLERDAIVAALQRASNNVRVAADAKDFLTALASQPDVVVLGSVRSVSPELVKATRAACATSYVIVVADGAPDIASLLKAGAQDFVRRPVISEEIVARATAPARVREWVNASSEFDVRSMRVWPELAPLIGHDLSQLIGTPLPTPIKSTARLPHSIRAGAIVMSLVRHKVEIKLSIVADDAALAWLGGALLGNKNPDASAVSDLLRELSNTAGGSVKRAALIEGIKLTASIPNDDVPSLVENEMRSTWLLSQNFFFAVVVEIRKKENLLIPASKLAEGMVLIDDVRNHSGALLAAAGTRLTSTTAQRVGAILGSTVIVEVADAA
jgi:DNA-binding response OmpR family regulator